MPSSRTKVLAITINYKTPDMTLRAVRAALPELEKVDGRLVVVDNDSGDGSYAKLSAAVAAESLGDRVEVVESGHNGGFGAGNNFAIRRALASDDPPEFFYLLNSDAFPDPGSLARLVAETEARPEVGIAGSYIHGEDGEPHRTAFRFPTVASELERSVRLGLVSRLLSSRIVALPIPDGTVEVDWLAGASMLIRRRVLEDVGLFDETFFLYFEETDLCRRAKAHGWKTVYVRQSEVTHIGSVSTGMKTVRRMPSYWFDSRRHYFRKNHGAGYWWAANAAHVVGGSLWRVRRAIQKKPAQDPPGFLRDLVKHAIENP